MIGHSCRQSSPVPLLYLRIISQELRWNIHFYRSSAFFDPQPSDHHFGFHVAIVLQSIRITQRESHDLPKRQANRRKRQEPEEQPEVILCRICEHRTYWGTNSAEDQRRIKCTACSKVPRHARHIWCVVHSPLLLPWC